MNCETARLLSLFNRPGDLLAEDATALATHRAGCPACAALATTQTVQDTVLSSAMKAVTLPVGFQDALRTSAIRTQASIVRRLWIRNIAATAAAVVCGLTALGGYSLATRPTVDVEMLLANFEPANGPSTAADVERWRIAEGLPLLPADFNLNLVTFTGDMALEGRNVPAMQLRAGAASQATIYFVRNSRFTLTNASDSVGSTGTVRVYQSNGWTVIVLHTGTNLQPFLNRDGSSA